MRKFLMSFLVLVMVGLAGCFGSDVGNSKGEVETVYSAQLQKIMLDAKSYASSPKRAGTKTVLEEGIYIIMDEAGQKVLYSYSVDDLVSMTKTETQELLIKLGIAGPKGNVYIVFGDNSMGLFEYVSIEDTKNNGIAPGLDPSMMVANKGTTVGDVTAKAIVDEIPLDMVSTTAFTMVLKYPFIDSVDGSGILGDRVDLVLANSEPKVVHTGFVSEISEDGFVAKVSMTQELAAGKVYLPRSSSESRIYFGSNAVIVPGASDEIYVYSTVSVANGEFTVRMNRAESTLQATDFTVIEIIGNKANYAENIKIKSMDGAFVTFTVKPVAQTSVEQVLSYKIAYKNTPQISTGKVIVPPTGTQKAIINVKAENGKVFTEMNSIPTTTDLSSVVISEYVDGVNTNNISLTAVNSIIVGKIIETTVTKIAQKEKDQLVYYTAKYATANAVESNKFVIEGNPIVTTKQLLISDVQVTENQYVDVYISAEEFTETDVMSFHLKVAFDNNLLQIENPNTDIELLNGFDTMFAIKNVEGGLAEIATSISTGKNPNGNLVKIRFKAKEVDSDKVTNIRIDFAKIQRPNFVDVLNYATTDKGIVTIKNGAVTGAKVLMTPSTTSVTAGQTFELVISGSEFTQTDMAGFSIYLAYDEALIDIVTPSTDVVLLSGYTSMFAINKKAENPADGTFGITSPFGIGSGTPKTINADLVRIKFTAKANGKASIAFGTVDLQRADMSMVTGFNKSSNTSITIGTVTSSGKLDIAANKSTVSTGEEVTLTVSGSEFTAQGGKLTADINYDENLFTFTSNSVTMLNTLSGVTPTVSNTSGKVSVSATPSSAVNMNNGLFTLKFQSKTTEGNGSFSLGTVSVASIESVTKGLAASVQVSKEESGDMRVVISDDKTGNIAVGTQFEVVFSGRDFNGTKGNGIEAVISFDTSIIDVPNSADPLSAVTMLGVFATNGMMLPTTQEAGKVKLVCTTGNAEIMDTDLFKVKFVAKQNGATNINLDSIKMASEDNSSWLNVAKTDKGEIQVGTTPVRTLESITITGNSTLKAGETLNLTATANYSAAPLTEDVTNTANWTSGTTANVTVNKGVVTGVAAGSSVITASFNGKTATKTVTVEPSFDGVVLYVNKSSAPTIWCWEDGGKAICTLMGLLWDTQKAMTAAPEEGNGWYKFEIASEYVTAGGKPINVILNKTENLPARTSGKTGWFKDGAWTDTNPDGPSKPEVTISPNGGTKKGTDKITITINGDDITSKSATFAGKTITLTLPTTTITLSDYITTDKGTGTLTVTAENAQGADTKTANFTRDDNPEVVETDFTWDNALVYFVLTDRFNNGDTSNDNSYNRKNSGLPSVATFHGGDIKGLTQKLDYLDSLGVNAIWVTAPYEQIHGWVAGKNKSFPHYAFHGYYAQDWTFMDKNMGTVEEFRTFVKEAHNRGIRVVMDVVVNHFGYNTTEDMLEYGFGKTSQTERGWVAQTNGQWDANVGNDWQSQDWGKWWSGWARGFGGNFGFGQEYNVNSDPLKGSLAGLPDVMTDKTESVGIPQFLKTKWAREDNATYDNWRIPAAANLRTDNLGAPADYIIKWLGAWVEEFGIDGFRCDTVKHVETYRWNQLKQETKAALTKWRNSSRSDGDPAKNWSDDFWMTGEEWGYGFNLGSDKHTQGGFDSMINFSFNGSQGGTGRVPTTADWAKYANDINNSPYNLLSYVSSHDTGLCRPSDMKQLGTMLILLPGGVQIFYGDETARPKVDGGGDTDMETRGDMNWSAVDGDVNSHWKKVGTFRRNNPAVGAGTQTDLGNDTYGRVWNNNKVVIKINANGSTSVNVSGIFADGTAVRNAYNGEEGTVSGGKVTFTGENGVILIEAK